MMCKITTLFHILQIFFNFYLVGVAGFEPTTSWSQTRRDNRTTLHPEGDHDRIRTCDRLLRRQMLYPAELRDLHLKH